MAGFNPPITTTAPQQFQGWPLSRISAGDERPAFLGLGRVFFAGRAAKVPDLTGGHKADLFRSGVLETQFTPFVPSPILLTSLSRSRRIPRGEKSERTTVHSPSCATTPDWF